MTIALAIWILCALCFIAGYIVCALMTMARTTDVETLPRDPLKYEGRDLPNYGPRDETAIDYIDRVKCPNTGIDTRYCTCLTCGTAKAHQSAIKGRPTQS
jgi:hypothetical protein